MEVLERILCDYDVTQPLYYGKEEGKFYFLLAPIYGFGDTGQPQKYLDRSFDEIKPLPAMNGTSHIAVRNGKTWTMWRYSSMDDKEQTIVPSEYYLLAGRKLEELRNIKGNSIEECLELISKTKS